MNKYRKQDLLPAVIYGHKIESRNLWVSAGEFRKIYNQAGESSIIELDIDSENKVGVLIHDIQRDPLTDNFLHIDFFQVKMDEKIETEVPLEFVGESPAVKESGGMLIKNISAIPVSCLPGDLPSRIIVDISVLKTFDDHIVIENLKISDKVKILVDGKTVIAGVVPPRSDEELAKLDEKVEEDVTKVEGVVKETPVETTEKEEEEKKKE